VIHASGRWEERGERAPAEPLPRTPPFDQGALPAPDRPAAEAARRHSATLTKPIGSLGRLEDLASWYAGVRGVFPHPRVTGAVALFAADHGVVSEGVSAYASTITAAVVANVMAGGAAVSALAREHDLAIALTDVGVAGDLSAAPTSPVTALRRRKVRAGTGNILREPAMSREEALAAIEAGAELSRELARAGVTAIALGEIGIGNTTAAAALTAVFTGRPAREVVGPGTGVAGEVLAHKLAVIEASLARHRPDATDPVGVVAALGGLEIAALAGCALEAARLRVAVVLDGFVTNAAALLAAQIDPAVRGYLLAAHASTEPGAAHALAHLGLRPLLDLRMRLGEGTGAVLGLALLRSAVHTQLAMATFATAGVVGRAGLATSSGR
jgi:nicotinate-nucleotide--dimethylbenzimidazole phosphoribosyltransferase